MARIRPYLFKSTYQWIVDHKFTPYVLVDAEFPEVEVPKDYAKNGRIVFNISPISVRHFSIEDNAIHFEASFGGIACQIFIPVGAVLGLYSRETAHGLYQREEGLGMVVNEGETKDDLDPNPPKPEPSKSRAENIKKAKALGLRVVK